MVILDPLCNLGLQVVRFDAIQIWKERIIKESLTFTFWLWEPVGSPGFAVSNSV